MNKKYISIKVIIAISFIILSILQLTKTMIPLRPGMGDAQVRIYEIVTNSIEKNGIWQPLYFQLLKFSIALSGPFLGPRLLAVVSFALLTLSIYLLTKHIFKKESVALLTVILIISSSFFTDYLTVPITEILFTSFFILGICFLIDIKDSKFPYLSLVFFTLANALRFEGWILLPIIVLILYKKCISIRNILLFAFIYLLYPLIYLTTSWKITGQIMYIVNDYVGQTPHADIAVLPTLTAWIKKFIDNFDPLYLLLLLIFYTRRGIKHNLTKNEGLLLVLGFGSLFIPIFLRICVARSNWYPDQYLIFSIALFYPFLGYTIAKLIKFNKIFLVIFTCLVILSLSKNYYFKADKYKIPDISIALKKVKVECLYLFDQYNYPYDKNDIMYLGNQIRYNPLPWDSSLKDDAETWSSCIILDNIKTEDEFLEEKCHINFQDERFRLFICKN